MDPGYYDSLLRAEFGGRKVIVCADVLVGAAGTAKSLLELGAARPLLIAGSEGTGELPSPDEADCIVLGLQSGSLMQGIRNFESALLDVPAEVQAQIDRYDPDHAAIVVGTIFTHDTGEMWGRRTFGGRPITWERLEDKMLVDSMFDAAHIERTASTIVVADPDALRRAAHDFDRGLGTAWAGDAKEDWWGGGEYLRWVRSDDDLVDAIAFFGAHCDRVRVMPFLEGVPCSIHGMVVSDEVIAFRPVEMLTLRRPASNKLLYAGLATYWDPPDADREAMREAARRMGAHLREAVDYRGIFTLDGVMTEEGFRPTEMNPRAGAGIFPQAAASKINLGLLSTLVRNDRSADIRPRELEAYVIERADAERAGRAYTVIDQKHTETVDHPVVEEDGTYRLAPDAGDPDGRIRIGPSTVGGLVIFRPDPTKLPKGPAFAPKVVRAFALADAELGTTLGPLEAARDVRI